MTPVASGLLPAVVLFCTPNCKAVPPFADGFKIVKPKSVVLAVVEVVIEPQIELTGAFELSKFTFAFAPL